MAAIGLLSAAATLASLDPKDMDPSASPASDFYQYAEGGWVKANAIPADKSSWGSFDEVNDNNEKVLHAILEKAAKAENPGFVEKLVGDFYASGMDEAAIEAAGPLPLKPLLDRVAAVSSKDQFGALVADLHLKGVGVCFGFGSEQDPKDSGNVIAGQGQGGLGLPDRDYYFRDDDASKKIREKYLAHVAKMLVLSGDSEAAAKDEAQAVMKLETALASGSKKAEELRDPVANYHPMAPEGLQKLSAHFDWTAYLSNLGLAPAPAKIDVGQPEFVQAFDKAIVEGLRGEQPLNFMPKADVFDTGGYNWEPLYSKAKMDDVKCSFGGYVKLADGNEMTSEKIGGDWLHMLNGSEWKPSPGKMELFFKYLFGLETASG